MPQTILPYSAEGEADLIERILDDIYPLSHFTAATAGPFADALRWMETPIGTPMAFVNPQHN